MSFSFFFLFVDAPVEFRAFAWPNGCDCLHWNWCDFFFSFERSVFNLLRRYGVAQKIEKREIHSMHATASWGAGAIAATSKHIHMDGVRWGIGRKSRGRRTEVMEQRGCGGSFDREGRNTPCTPGGNRYALAGGCQMVHKVFQIRNDS